MKNFIQRVSLAAGIFLLLVAVSWIVRVVLYQREVDMAYAVPAGTEVVCLGNSHTGCSWSEEPRFRNKLIWRASECILWAEMRLRELARRGQLDGVKYCIVNFDGPTMMFFQTEWIENDFLVEMPVAWRYVSMFPVSYCRLAYRMVERANREFCVLEKQPEGLKPWSQRTEEERRRHLGKTYRYDPKDWDDPIMCPNWESLLLQSVGRMKEICDGNEIRLILFAAPLIPEHLDRTDPVRYNKINEIIEKVKSMDIEFYDCREVCDETMFRDSHHLSKEGAVKFTEDFYRRFLNLGVE